MTVLTIDFDIIMYLSLPTYNDFISKNYPFDGLVKDYPFMQYCQADLILYKDITGMLLTMFQRLDKNQIRFVNSHESIVHCVEDIDTFNLINIDHHHDIGYGDTTLRWDEKIESLECGNWVKYLFDIDKIDSYVWVSNSNSTCNDDIPNRYRPDEIIQIPYEIRCLPNFFQKADRVIICGSFWWIPPLYRPLFDTWIEMYKSYYNIEEEIEVL